MSKNTNQTNPFMWCWSGNCYNALLRLKTYFAPLAIKYCNDPKFSDRKLWANSADPDQTAPRGPV